MGKQVSHYWFSFPSVLMGVGILCGATNVFAEFSEDSSGLPELSGFGYRSDAIAVPLQSNNTVENVVPEKEHLNRLRDKLTKRLNLDISDSVRIGVQRFTKHNGKRRYGLGIKKQLEDRELNLMLTSSGVNVNTQVDDYGVGFMLESHAPGDSDGSPYLGVGVNKRW